MIRSKQRDMILDTLRAYPIHPTAEELYTILKDTVEATVSLATVYRNLGQLADAGMIIRISVPDSPDRFDGTISPHHHMRCDKCGRVTDIPADAVPEICSCAAKATGASHNGVQHTLPRRMPGLRTKLKRDTALSLSKNPGG